MATNNKGVRTISDSIMLDIYYEMLSNANGLNLNAWIKKQSQLVAMLDRGGYIKHRGGGMFILTEKGANHLRERYPDKFTRELRQ